MRTRLPTWLPIATALVPSLLFAATSAEAQPKLRDRTDTASGKSGALETAAAAAGQAGGSGSTGSSAAAPSAASTGSGGSGSSGTTGSSAAAPGGATPPKGATIGPNGKAQSDTTGLAQFENALEFEPRSPNYKVAFSLEDADLAELVRVIGQLTGKRFIFGGKVKNIKATVYSPQKVTVAEAYQAFLSILETNGLTVVPHGRFLKIVETAGAAAQGTPIYGASSGAPGEDRYVTRMHRLGHISADDAAAVLGKFKSKDGDITVYGPGNMIIVTDSGANIRRMFQLLEEIDVGSSGDQIFIEPVHYASAQDVEKRINELFDVKSGGAAPSGGTSKGGQPGAGAASASIGGQSSELHVAKIVADDRSNSLIIVATERAYLRILELVKRIDVPQTGEGEIHVLPLQHADATELTKTLNEIITGAAAPAGGAPGGRGAAQPAAQAPSGIFEGGVKVSADKATNSIVVTSSLRDYASLRSVIDRLDQPRRQVFIEAVVMDLQLNRRDVLGVSFHGGAPFTTDQAKDSLVYGGNKILNTISPLPTDPDALQGFALGVRGPGITGVQNFLGTGISIPAFGTFLQALATTGDSDLLSTPHILALDNEDAEINVGENVPLQSNNSLGGLGALGGLGGATGAAGAAGALGALGGLGGLGSFGVPRQDVGTKIKIKPHLNDSNEVRLDVTEEISEVGASVGGTSGAFNIGKRTATTKLVVADQQTIVIGGLVRNVLTRSEEKVPLLGDIPVLGALFRKRENRTSKRNLILVMTPYIIRSQQDLRTVFERKMQERQEYLDRYFVFSDANDYKAPKDWTRTNGLVEDIRQSYFQLEERRRLDEITRPRELKTHDPQRPLEMPQGVRASTTGATGNAPAAPASGNPSGTINRETGTTSPTPPVNVNPAVRNLEKIEK